ncbi:gliding motility-associated C-terminal domain-containing protein [Maribacter sp. 2-571]|uniref:gliding motility-associated C-terminal domain-containing protein n=1 Tax=Maribacter sp. 2-571 TaxID=3417569 RepID=UPI003D34FDBE
MKKNDITVGTAFFFILCCFAMGTAQLTDAQRDSYRKIAEDAMLLEPNSFDLRASVPNYQFGNGLAGDDFWPFPGWRAHNGETTGFDTFMTVEPRDAVPGLNEVHFHDGTERRVSNDPDFSQPGDRYFLGDHSKTFYTGRQGTQVDRDFTYIEFFEVGPSRIYIHGAPEDYVLVDVVEPYAGTALFLKKGTDGVVDDDFMAIFLEVSAAEIPLDSDHYEYATAPRRAVKETAGGIDQVQTASIDVWPTVEVDPRGNVFMAMRTPDPLPNNANPGCGCDLAAIKYDGNGNIVWQGNYGDGRWGTAKRTSRIFDSVYEDGFYFLGVFIGNDRSNGGGRFQVVKINAETGEQVGIFEYDPGPGVDNVTGIAKDNNGKLFVSGSSSSSINEGPGPFFLKVDQDQISSGQNGFEAWVDGGIEGTFFHEGHGGVAFMPDGSGIPGKGTVANAGWNNLVVRGNHHAMWLRLWSDSGELKEFIPLTDGDDFPGWAWQVEFDSAGFAYVVGAVHGVLDDFPRRRYGGKGDIVVFKVDVATATLVDATLVGSEWSDEGIDLFIDERDNLFITGHTYGSLFAQNPAPGRYADGFVLKMDTDLNVLEGFQIGTEREDHFTGLVVKNGIVYVTGFTEGSLFSSIDTTTYNTDAVLFALKAQDLSYATITPFEEEAPVVEAPSVEGPITVYNVVTRNQDGQNDYLKIDGIENYPDNTLSIYNRSGTLEYQTTAYGTDDALFYGVSNQGSAKGMVGTYIYILEYRTSEGPKQKNGWMFITD